MSDVVLVDEHDRPTGVMEKQLAHVRGVLHRAISVFILDSTGERMLIQRRALDKYHSAGLWSNACCSHPLPDEAPLDAAHRRLQEELGFDCPLEFAFSFEYRAEIGELVEHELDHVFVGRCDPVVRADPSEIDSTAWISVGDLVDDVRANPSKYSAWLAIALPRVIDQAA